MNTKHAYLVIVRAILTALTASVLLVVGASTSQATVDYTCRVSTISFDKAYNTYWTGEGVGLVGWRVRGNLRVYDQCTHGGIAGTVGIYSANVAYKGGRIGFTNYLYNDSSSSAWRRDGMVLRGSFSSGGWDNYDVLVSGNIGLTPQTWIRYVRLNTAVSFYGVPGASRTIICTKGSPYFTRYTC